MHKTKLCSCTQSLQDPPPINQLRNRNASSVNQTHTCLSLTHKLAGPRLNLVKVLNVKHCLKFKLLPAVIFSRTGWVQVILLSSLNCNDLHYHRAEAHREGGHPILLEHPWEKPLMVGITAASCSDEPWQKWNGNHSSTERACTVPYTHLIRWLIHLQGSDEWALSYLSF